MDAGVERPGSDREQHISIMSIKEKFVETQFFKRVKRTRIGALLSLDQLNVAGQREGARTDASVPPGLIPALVPSVFKKIAQMRRPPLLPLIILLLATAPAMAQELHLSAGYNGSKITKPGTEDWRGRGGFQFGVDALIGTRWFIKPGVHYVQRSMSYGVANGTLIASDRYTYTSRAVAIPVMLGTYFLNPDDIRSFNAYFMAGPTALIGLNSDPGYEFFSVETRATQWYLGLGLGMSYGPVFIEGGYNAAMSNVFKGEGLDTNPRVNNTYVIAGVRLHLAQ
jgi:hypothetical protein